MRNPFAGNRIPRVSKKVAYGATQAAPKPSPVLTGPKRPVLEKVYFSNYLLSVLQEAIDEGKKSSRLLDVLYNAGDFRTWTEVSLRNAIRSCYDEGLLTKRVPAKRVTGGKRGRPRIHPEDPQRLSSRLDQEILAWLRNRPEGVRPYLEKLIRREMEKEQ